MCKYQFRYIIRNISIQKISQTPKAKNEMLRRILSEATQNIAKDISHRLAINDQVDTTSEGQSMSSNACFLRV